MTSLDLIVFGVYLLLLLFLGGSFFKKNRSAKNYILGSGGVPTWVVSLSIFATFVSSISYLALPGSAFQSNWNPLVFSFSIPFASLIAVRYFIPVYRKTNSPSAYTFIANRLGNGAKYYVSLCYLITQLMRIGTILYLLAIAINAIVGWDIVWIIILTGFFVSLYSILGGIDAVLWTDAIQAIILIGGVLFCLIFIVFKMPEGVSQIMSIAQQQQKFSLGSMSLDFNDATFWVVLIYGFFVNLQNFGIDQNYIQRYMVLPSLKKAQRSAFVGGLIYLPVSALFLFLGTALFSYYKVIPTLPPDLWETTDKIFPYFIAQEIPKGFAGLLIASIFAAGMSTISTSYNSMSTVFVTDYFSNRFLSKENSKVRILYFSTALSGLISIIIALSMIDVKGVLDVWWKYASICSGGMLGLFLLGVIAPLKNNVWIGIAVILGIATLLWINVSGQTLFHSYLSIVLGTTILFGIGFLGSIIRKK